MQFRPLRTTVAAGAILALAGGAALAHHGWAWVSDEPFTLTGTITEVYVGNPHVELAVETDEGVWEVDLAPLVATTNAGFTEESATAGDEITAYGHRSLDMEELAMKAVRIEVNGVIYDVYPDRTGPFD